MKIPIKRLNLAILETCQETKTVQEILDSPEVAPYMEYGEDLVRLIIRSMAASSLLQVYGQARGTMYRISPDGKGMLNESR